MKSIFRFFPLALSALALAIAAGCSTISGVTGAVQTPAEIASEVCPPVQAALQVLAPASPTMSVTAQKSIAKATTAVNVMCGAAQTVNVSDVQTFAQTIVPALSTLVQASNLPNKAQLGVDLALAQVVINAVVQNLPHATPATGPGSPQIVTPAPAPAAAQKPVTA